MDNEAHEDLLGTVLDDRYKIVERLGDGAMGIVYLAEHAIIGRQVAIKVLNAEYVDSKDFAARFKREAIAAGRLDHPNCVPITDFGHLDDGSAYLVMEFVKGASLGHVLERDGPQFPPVRALRIVRHILRGLGHAHEAGIVHRDIKPDNVMLANVDGDPDFARVVDFGIAKLHGVEAQEATPLTAVGMALGTPSYLSPEQAVGGNVDHRSDLYSTTILLFEMLCGAQPYVADTLVAVLTKHAAAPIPHLQDFAKELGALPQLDAIVQRGMAKAREDRFSSAAEYVNIIDETLASMGSILTPAPLTNDSKEGVRVSTAMATHHTSESLPVQPMAAKPRVGVHNRYNKRIAIAALIVVGLILAIAVVADEGAPLAVKNVNPQLPASVFQAPVPIPVPINTDKLLREGEIRLRKGASCSERREAVEALRALGDKRAIPSLKKSRRRMRGGFVGFGQKNTNRCLRKDAVEAIKELEGL